MKKSFLSIFALLVVFLLWAPGVVAVDDSEFGITDTSFAAGPQTFVTANFGTEQPPAAAKLEAQDQWHAVNVAWSGDDAPVQCFQGSNAPGRVCIGIVQWCHMHRLMGEPADAHLVCQPPGESFAWHPD